MVILPYNLERTLLYNLFSSNVCRTSSQCTTVPSIDYANHNVFNKGLVTNISSFKESFVPSVAFKGVSTFMAKRIFENDHKEFDISIITPLIVDFECNKKSSDPMLRAMMLTGKATLTKIKAPTTVYYANSGILFDKDWVPLLMSGYICSFGVAHNSIHAQEKALCINPLMLSSNDSLPKLLVKKIIPWIMESSRRFSTYLVTTQPPTYDDTSSKPIKAVLEEFSDKIISASAPIGEDYNAAINDMLAKDADTIFSNSTTNEFII